MTNQNLLLPKGYNSDVRQRMFADCLDSLDPSFKPSTDPTDVALQHGRDARATVIAKIRPLLTNPLLKWDDQAKGQLAKTVAQEYASEFGKMSHSDLVYLVSVIHAQGMMDKIVEQCG